jgi:hypothetical protein
MSIAAMKQALEVLEYPGPSWIDARQPAITALRKAIAEAEQAQPAACTHGWFQTGAMEPGQMRCIHCGEWGQRTAHGIKEKT